MTFFKAALFCCFLLLCSVVIQAEVRAINLELHSSYQYTYNNALGHKNELFFSGEQKFNKYLSVGAGFSASPDSLPQIFFLYGELNEFPPFMKFRLSFLNHNFPQFEIKETSIIPAISLTFPFLDLTFGMAYRILNSDVQTASTHILYSLTINFVNRPVYGLSLNMSNFDNVRAGNISDIRYTIANRFTLNDRWTLIGDGGFSNSGQLSFASYYSSFFARIGVNYSI